MALLSIILQSLLVLYFAFSGGAKIMGAKYWVGIFEEIKLPQWFRVVTGYVQLIGVILLIVGYWVESTVLWAGLWLGITMILACFAHIRVKDSLGKTMPAVTFAVLNIILIILNVNLV